MRKPARSAPVHDLPATTLPGPGDAAGMEGTVRAVDRALVILKAFHEEDGALTLAEVARRAGLHLTTALRLLGTLEGHGFITRLPAGGYLLGPTLLLLGDVFRRSLRLEDHVMPALDRLRAESRESATFFVREGDQRRCLFRLDSPQLVRDHARVGEVQPLGRGAHGRALIVFEDTPPPRLPIISRGERLREIAAIAAPVLDATGAVVGSVGISVPLYRFDAAAETLCAPLVLREAIAMTRAMGGDPAPIQALAAK
ncbi:IclR family transcriptional regulator [Humitalea rosea]|uniref:IclR family transcriptional regulator n=1 Tax=Humitalea rosea TaxID=990373 RepID=A0A2W7I6M6_9PROT|nr:helix-turn-helix domain-containing protein [Humitalea rosea]PZW40795.1 IclR family transcriptional regulator [Humitalea rosea]